MIKRTRDRDDLEYLIPAALPGRAGEKGDPGTKGDKGDPGEPGSSGINAFTTTTAAFTMPAPNGNVNISVATTAWLGVGLAVFIETAGYFKVSAILSASSATFTAMDASTNAPAGAIIASGKKVVSAGVPSLTYGDFSDLAGRVDVLEQSPGGNKNYYSGTQPTGSAFNVNDLWFDTAHGYKMYRWDGTGWVDIQHVLSLADFGTGIRPIVTVSSLPPTGNVGDYVHLSTDGKLYRWVTTPSPGWTKAIATGDLVGQVDGSTFIVDGTLIASKFAAGSVTADAVGANRIITTAANIGTAVITDAHISTISAGKITAGDVVGVNFSHSGRIFHASYQSKKFQAVEFGTSFQSNKNFGTGSAYTFSHCTPVTAYAPGHSSWGVGGAPTACPDSNGAIRVQMQGRLIGYTGYILLYYQVNNGPYQALYARNASDGGDAIADGIRVITGISATDAIKFYVAPADGSGNAVSPGVTCRYELDVTFFNW